MSQRQIGRTLSFHSGTIRRELRRNAFSDGHDHEQTQALGDPRRCTAWTWAKRLAALESRIAYQEHWLDTLDQAVAAQEARLTQLERINVLMQRKIREKQQALQEGDAAAPSAEDELPPHY